MRKIRILYKRIRSKLCCINEYCHFCGKDNYAWSTDDNTFKTIIGSNTGIYCLRCFDAVARSQGMHPIYRIKVENLLKE